MSPKVGEMNRHFSNYFIVYFAGAAVILLSFLSIHASQKALRQTDWDEIGFVGRLGTESSLISLNRINSSLAAYGAPSSCLIFNSQEWLEGPRHGNAFDRSLTKDQILELVEQKTSVLESLGRILAQTIAHENSFFLDLAVTNTTSFDKKLIRVWAIRLIYLSIHYHQHHNALNEVRAMYVSDEKGSTCAAEREAYLLRNFDFECPGTRFLAVSLWDNGIGANMNYIAVPALMAGLVTNRVVLFVNKVPGKRKIMSTRWSLASCPRRDFQCFFKAASPCVPTVKELNEAYGLTRTEKQDLFHRGEVPIGHENDKVIYMMGLQKTPSMHLGGRLESTLYNISMSLIDSAATKVADPALLRSAADSITSQDGNRPGYHFQFSTSKIHHGLLFYALRPSLLSKHRINSILNQVVPANFDPAKSIGLPIRASDKCVRESECLSFLQHIQVAGKAWKRHQEAFPMDDRFRPIILFTTESSVMLNEQHTFVNRSGSRHLNFVLNKFDVTPNAGRIYESSKFTADQAMLSSVVTLKLQLMARITLGNCCSNYHNLIHAFLVEGCGSARQNSFECLQENDDPEFRVCCWNSRSCIEERHRQMDQSANSSRPDFLRSLYEPT